MRLQKCEFIRSAMRADQFFDDLPEIVFCGRSNVGKSSLLNAILGRKSLARTSATPGKTAAVNYFLVDDAVYFVDLPGYGYAKVSDAEKARWDKLMADYFSDNTRKKLAVLLVDLRHKPTALDNQMADMLADCNIPFVAVGTKADKLKPRELETQKAQFAEWIKGYGMPCVAVSSAKRTGIEELKEYIAQSL